MAAVEVPQTLEYRGGQLNAAPVLEVENFTNWKKRNTNNVKDFELASLFGKLIYEENLIDSIYETEKNKSLVSTTPLSTAFFSSTIVQDFQDSPDDEEDTRSSHEYLNDLEEEYQARALLAKSKRFFKKSTHRFSSAKATNQTKCHKCGKKDHFARDCWSKTLVFTMVPPNNLGPDLNGKSVNETQYRGMIGSLMFLTASKPDIQFSTCLCARYEANPKESHLIAVKIIFRYLKDSNYAGCNMDRKSTSGACQLLGGKLVCWSAKKQQSVAMSSTEAEYVAAAGCCSNILWMKSQLTDYDIIYEKVPIFCDNTIAIAISNNPVLHSRTKHIDIRYHFIRDYILKGDIELYFIPTQYQLADIFTKPLDEPNFKRLIVELAESSSPDITPKEEHVTLGIPESPNLFLPATQVEFTFDEITFTTNNEVALIYPSHLNQEYFMVVSDFISKCCLKEAFTRAPTQYQEYLREFWYTPKTLEDSKVWVSTPTCGVRGEIGITTFRNAIRAHYLPHSSMWRLLMGQIIQCLGGKTGGLDQISNKDATILYCLANGIQVDYAYIIWEDLILKLNKKNRKKIVPYPRFISLLLEHMAPKYDNEELTINPTYVFSVHNWILKPNQPKEPPFTDHMKAICNLDVHVDSKAPKYSSPTEEVPQGKKPRARSGLRRKQSSKHTSKSTTEASKS
ncbi:retrovirus-related pol polyprotein from transposon TNT 1-94 [Tanacetum coccineum]